jgi:hypothetical protein
MNDELILWLRKRKGTKKEKSERKKGRKKNEIESE